MAKEKKQEKINSTTEENVIFGILIGAIILGLILGGFALYRTYETEEEGAVRYNSDDYKFEYYDYWGDWEKAYPNWSLRFVDKNKQIEQHYRGHWYCINEELRKSLGIDNIEKKIKCLESGGHEYQFEKVKSENFYFDGEIIGTTIPRFIFKCNKCGTEVGKSKSELTDSELQALKELGIVKD